MRRAPSAGFSQGHRLVVVTEPDDAASSSPVSPARTNTSPWAWSPGSRSRPSTSSSACARRAITSATAKEDKLVDGEEITWPAPYWYVDAGSLFMLLQLAALSEGLGTGVYGVPGERRARAQGAARDSGGRALRLRRDDRQAAARTPTRAPLVSRLTERAPAARRARSLGARLGAPARPLTTGRPVATLQPSRHAALLRSARSRARACRRHARRRRSGSCERAVRRPRRRRSCRSQVNGRGEALVTYRTPDGVVRHVYVWGAVNAVPARSGQGVRCASVRLLGRLGEVRPADLATFRERAAALRRARARVARRGLQGARTAPTGRSSAGSGFCRMRGFEPSARPVGVRAPSLALVGTAARAPGVAELDVRRPVARALRPAHLRRAARSTGSGRRRRGNPSTAMRASSTSTPSTRRSGAAGGTSREGRAQPQRRLLLQLRAPDHAARVSDPGAEAPGNGERHRVTVMGPGVTPVIQWEGPALGRPTRAGCGLRRALRPARGSGDRVCVPSASARTAPSGRSHDVPLGVAFLVKTATRRATTKGEAVSEGWDDAELSLTRRRRRGRADELDSTRTSTRDD